MDGRAENGRVGLERLAESKPDLILLDLMMPEMDGFDFAAELRRRDEWRVRADPRRDRHGRLGRGPAQLNGHVLGILQRRATPATRRLLDEIRHEIQVHLARKPAAKAV